MFFLKLVLRRRSSPVRPLLYPGSAGVWSMSRLAQDNRAGLRGYVQFNTYTYIHTYIHTYIPPWEDRCEWHRMTRMTGPDCAVMCNLISIRTYINTYIHTGAQGTLSLSKNCTSRESVSPLSRLINASGIE